MRKNILILGHNDATQFVDIYNQYTRLFDSAKYHVTVAYLTGAPSEEARRRTLAHEVLFLNASKKNIRGLKIGPIRQLLALCREKNFQLVVCHRYKPSYIMMWTALLHHIPALIFVMHELDTLSSLRRKLLVAGLSRNNMLFAGVSNAVRDDIRRHIWRVPHEQVATLYNVMDVDLTEPKLLSREEARKALQLPDDAFVFGNLARLVPNKDQKSLIHAFSLLKASCPQAKLILIGNGVLETQLKEQVKSIGLEEDIIFTGYLMNGFRYMKALDCFVLSSIQEAFGRVLLEAMLAKCPIIATKAHGIPEVIGEAGNLVEQGNTAQLSAAMQAIYALPPAAREKMGEKGYTHLLKHFSIPVFHQQFWQLPLVQSIKE